MNDLQTQNYLFQMLKPLVGGKIKKIIIDPTPDGEVYTGFIVEKNKTTYEVLGQRDAEGNGAGFIQITEIANYK